MTTQTNTQTDTPTRITQPATTRPEAQPRTLSRLRRAAVVTAGVLACALPTVFTVNITRMLLVGELDEHRFHQLTGQGLLLFALWLGGLVPLLRAGWAGRRPAAPAGWLHLGFLASGAACATAAPGGGAPYLVGVVVGTGALVWLALPVRPALRLAPAVDPLLAPLALVTAAASTPYVLGQLALQRAAVGHHAQNPHLFDMAWLVSTLVVAGLAAALCPALRRLGVVAGAGLAATGVAGVVLAADRPFTVAAVALGTAMLSTSLVSARRAGR